MYAAHEEKHTFDISLLEKTIADKIKVIYHTIVGKHINVSSKRIQHLIFCKIFLDFKVVIESILNADDNCWKNSHALQG